MEVSGRFTDARGHVALDWRCIFFEEHEVMRGEDTEGRLLGGT